MESIKCLNPRIILNPTAINLIRMGSCKFIVNGREIRTQLISRKKNDVNFAAISTRVWNPTTLNLDSFLIVRDGVQVRLYMAVPCNHCALCRARGREDWATRCECEALASLTTPVFATLTYDNEHLPINRITKVKRVSRETKVTRSGHETRNVYKHEFTMTPSLRKEHVQRFMNLLRKYLERKLGYKNKLRYVVVGEYGSKTHRPHYHIIIFNFPDAKFFGVDYGFNEQIRDINYIQFCEKLLHKFWEYSADNKSFDFDYVGVTKVVDPRTGYRVRNIGNKGNGKGCAKYVAKYVHKDGCVPYGADSMRMLCSNRGGGIGVPFIKDSERFAHYSNPINSQFVHFPDGKKASMPQLFKKHLYPCVSSVYKKDIRDAAETVFYACNTWSYLFNVLDVALFDGVSARHNFVKDYPTVFLFQNALYDYQRFNMIQLLPYQGTPISVKKLAYLIRSGRYDSQSLNDSLSYLKSLIDESIGVLEQYAELTPDYDAACARKRAYSDYIASLDMHKVYDVEVLNKTQEFYDNLSTYKETF